MKNQKPLVDKDYFLERFPGKGGWTYVVLPEIHPVRTNPFGWVLVTGKIDECEIEKARLMPMGNGRLFLPVNARMRKKLGKEAGQRVHIVLYADLAPGEITDELMSCLELEPGAVQAFLNLSLHTRKACLNRIHEAKTEEMKIERINQLLDELKDK